MTPPPSSQAPVMSGSQSAHSKDPMRTPTPTHSHLSSPPPTVKGPVGPPPMIPEQDNRMPDTIDGLRSKLHSTMDSLERARLSLSHSHLQWKLLWIEHNEAKKRAEVELDMSRKEVEVLCERKPQAPGPLMIPMTPNARSALPSPSDQEVTALRNRCAALQIDNDKLKDQLDEFQTVWRDRMTDLEQENFMLRERIRENRHHINQIRASGNLATPSTLFNTPRTTGRNGQPTPSLAQPGSTSKAQGHAAFDQLLLADQMLSSQELATTPSTPTSHSRGRHNGHHRGVQSLSSLPTTPIQARSLPQHPYQTPTTARPPQIPHTAPAGRHRRRESRDSTISATDAADNEDGAVFDRDLQSSPSLIDIEPSRASQEAASMLRKSFNSGTPQGSQGRDEALRSSGLLQSKLSGYGRITKAGATGAKRKPSGSPVASHASPTKKGRGEGVGLGIGGWESRRV
ncbi:MAG: hypothetical protein Q9162_000785 [Coniocarpon cinnabarinum]